MKQADNFDLKKYLVENKVTTNSKIMNEGDASRTVDDDESSNWVIIDYTQTDEGLKINSIKEVNTKNIEDEIKPYFDADVYPHEMFDGRLKYDDSLVSFYTKGEGTKSGVVCFKDKTKSDLEGVDLKSILSKMLTRFN